jgi:hypothetical protein
MLRGNRMNAVTTNAGPHECGHYERTSYKSGFGGVTGARDGTTPLAANFRL